MKKMITTGKTIEEAVKTGLSQFNTTEDRVKVHVLEQPTKGLFGLIGAKEAKVELELIPDAIEIAVRFLEEMFDAMNLKVKIEQADAGEHHLLNLIGDELGILIGKRGQTLDSIQYLVNIVANRHSANFVRIILDAEHFRQRRQRTLEELAERLANRVIRTKQKVMLEPMSPQERKIIHSHLQDHPDVETFSKGEDPNRRIVIALKIADHE